MNKLIGGIFLIIGTCIGASMLALPVTTAPSGFVNALFVILLAWLTMTYSSLLLAEVNAVMPSNSNLISMAHFTLGKYGASLTWCIYLILLYSLLSAYIAGGSELLINLLALLNIHLSSSSAAILFTFIFGTIVYKGILTVDWVNRGLMSGKLLALILLCGLLLPHTDLNKIEHFQFKNIYSAVMLIFCAFGYGIIIPSIRDYFNNDVKQLRRAIIVGSLIPLTCYACWIFLVQGTLVSQTATGLIAMSAAAHPIALMVNALSETINNSLIAVFVHFFTSICILTAFLGVSLSLSDFLADGFKIEKIGRHKLLITAFVFLPPLTIVLFKPDIFVSALSLAGIFCVVLLILTPNLMAWSKRYKKAVVSNYQVVGGKTLLAFNILLSIALIIFGLANLSN